MDVVSAQPIIEKLERIRRTPALYIGLEPAHIAPFLLGVRAAASAFGLTVDAGIYTEIVREHNLEIADASFWLDWERLKRQVADERSALDTLIAIEIEMWQRITATR